jgi:predicted metal-dependent phosphoesterase TrpH
MKYKISLHNHATEDPIDGYWIDYDIFGLIDRAKSFEFSAIAITCHEKVITNEKYYEYARSKGMLLISGIELSLKRSIFWQEHILILNCGKETEKIKNYSQLKEFKQNHPESFIVSPHPGFGNGQSIGIKKLARQIDLFDAIEHSWFYSLKINLNLPAVKLAKEHNKPLICTADAHNLKHFNDDFITVEADELTAISLFNAIREGKFQNTTKAKTMKELLFFYFGSYFKGIILSFRKNSHNKKYLDA